MYCFVVYTFNEAACRNVNALHVSVKHLLAQKGNQSGARNPLANDSHPPNPHPSPTYLAATTQIRAQAQWPRPSAPTRIP